MKNWLCGRKLKQKRRRLGFPGKGQLLPFSEAAFFCQRIGSDLRGGLREIASTVVCIVVILSLIRMTTIHWERLTTAVGIKQFPVSFL